MNDNRSIAHFFFHQLEQDHAAELQKLQDSVTATLNKHREHRKKVVAENEYLRATVQCVSRLHARDTAVVSKKQRAHPGAFLR